MFLLSLRYVRLRLTFIESLKERAEPLQLFLRALCIHPRLKQDALVRLFLVLDRSRLVELMDFRKSQVRTV